MIQTIIVIAIVAAAVLLAFRGIYKTVSTRGKKNVNCGSCCSAGSCGQSECD